MSIKLMINVWDSAPVEGSELIMLLALADQANEQGVCWPSQATLAKRCRVNKRHAQRILDSLKSRGLIIVHPRYRDDLEAKRVRSSNLYQIVFGMDLQTVNVTSYTPSPSRHTDRQGDVLQTVTPTSPMTSPSRHTDREGHDIAMTYKPSFEPSNETKGDPETPTSPSNPFLKIKGGA